MEKLNISNINQLERQLTSLKAKYKETTFRHKKEFKELGAEYEALNKRFVSLKREIFTF